MYYYCKHVNYTDFEERNRTIIGQKRKEENKKPRLFNQSDLAIPKLRWQEYWIEKPNCEEKNAKFVCTLSSLWVDH